MRRIGLIAQQLLLTVLMAALVIPCVHAHADLDHHEHDASPWVEAANHAHNHLVNIHAHVHHNEHGHDHEHGADAHHDHPAGDHRLPLHHDNPVADLLLRKLESGRPGHSHSVVPHAHFFNLLLEGKTDTPQPSLVVVADTEYEQAVKIGLHVESRADLDIAPALSSLDYIFLINNIPPPPAF